MHLKSSKFMQIRKGSEKEIRGRRSSLALDSSIPILRKEKKRDWSLSKLLVDIVKLFNAWPKQNQRTTGIRS